MVLFFPIAGMKALRVGLELLDLYFSFRLINVFLIIFKNNIMTIGATNDV